MNIYYLYKEIIIDYQEDQENAAYDKTYILLFEKLVDNQDGELYIDPIFLTFGNEKPSQRSFIDSPYKSDYRICTDAEVIEIENVGELQFCKNYNGTQIRDLLRKKEADEKILLKFQTSGNIENKILFYNKAIGRYLVWYNNNGFDYQQINIPAITSLINEVEPDQGSTQKITSNLDLRNMALEDSIKFINNEISKLSGKFKKRDIVRICSEAYDKIIRDDSGEGMINVSKFSENIFDSIDTSQFPKWTKKNFITYCGNRIPHIKKNIKK